MHDKAMAFLQKAREMHQAGQYDAQGFLSSIDVFNALGWPDRDKVYFQEPATSIPYYLRNRGYIAWVEAETGDGTQLNFAFQLAGTIKGT